MASTTTVMKAGGSGRIHLDHARDTLSGREENQMVEEEKTVLNSILMETGTISVAMPNSHPSVNLVLELLNSVKKRNLQVGNLWAILGS